MHVSPLHVRTQQPTQKPLVRALRTSFAFPRTSMQTSSQASILKVDECCDQFHEANMQKEWSCAGTKEVILSHRSASSFSQQSTPLSRARTFSMPPSAPESAPRTKVCARPAFIADPTRTKRVILSSALTKIQKSQHRSAHDQ